MSFKIRNNIITDTISTNTINGVVINTETEMEKMLRIDQ